MGLGSKWMAAGRPAVQMILKAEKTASKAQSQIMIQVSLTTQLSQINVPVATRWQVALSFSVWLKELNLKTETWQFMEHTTCHPVQYISGARCRTYMADILLPVNRAVAPPNLEQALATPLMLDGWCLSPCSKSGKLCCCMNTFSRAFQVHLAAS